MDSLVFEDSVNTEVSSSEFVEKQWLYVNDNNNQSYSSQVVLDTTSLSNSGSYINWSEAFILMPLLLQVQSTLITDDVIPADFLVSMKSGFWNMLHSITVEFNNGNIIQQVPFLNVFCNFKNLTSWSENDLVDWGSVVGFMPDMASSWLFNDMAPANNRVLAASGTGLCNNRNAHYVSIKLVVGSNFVSGPTLTSIAAYNTSTMASTASSNVYTEFNSGMYERQTRINYNTTVQASLASTNGQYSLMSDANCVQVFRSFINRATDLRYFFIDAIIRLKDIADFFQKCPLLKGSTMRMYINTNQCAFQVAAVGAQYSATTGQLATYAYQCLNGAPQVLGGGGTNPVMIASADLGMGLSSILPFTSNAGAATTGLISVQCSIVKQQFGSIGGVVFLPVGSAPVSSCRLYAPAYTFSPIAEQRYLSLSATKKVVYNDIFQYSFPAQSAGSNFNILVTNGCPNIRSVLVVPLITQASNGVPAAVAGVFTSPTTSSTILSPFCPTPSYPDPIAITNFQIQISGRNLFINQLQYDFEDFTEQFVSSNQLNGSLTTGLASGLISRKMWGKGVRYYYGNCSRSLPSEEGVAKAVQILGQIAAPPKLPDGVTDLKVDLMVFVEFEREITIDVRTGARIA
tara:strand:+ start:1784 stop:3673 length:1890 start_codon:yes stop_codon:yes gene_type:complete